ncbi:MAG: bifunctional hydroxymethylpyrimidine kinase/phosphomethylpyrimidine kinase [Smithellaceae bacterium]|nr:bifunctional hydroxymethylpyrimidine kinase/phosphomethylpyrimidine kinase [Smithellaceae bacterium]
MGKPVRVLCVGGSDSGGGAGIGADLKAVHACGCYAVCAVTAVTAQNTRGVQSVFPVPPKWIAAQLDSVLGDIGADAVKTGMLMTPQAVGAVVKKIESYRLKNVVVDPVMIAKGGHALMTNRARQALVKKLLPLADVVTPNVPEAEFLARMKIRSVEDMKKAAAVILDLGVKKVVVKGGHLPGRKTQGIVDILYDGKQYEAFAAKWRRTNNTHGTGCTFASILASHLARGENIYFAVEQAQSMTARAIQDALPLGRGHGPVNVLGIRQEN